MTDMIETEINGRWLLRLPEHRAARPEWPWWEAQRLACEHIAIRAMRRAGYFPTVVSVGAEEGDFPALYALWGGWVVMIEPNPKVWPNIRAIFEANNLTDSVLGWMVGFAGDHHRPQRRGWENPFASGADNTDTWPDCAAGEVIGDHGFLNVAERDDVPMARLDSIIGTDHPCDVVSIDVEGAEVVVVRGMDLLLTNQRPVVFVSWHESFAAEMYDATFADLVAPFDAADYHRRFICQDHEAHWVFTPTEREDLPWVK